MNRGSDSILSVYSDARAEYTKQLCVFLVPAYFQFFIDLLEKAKQATIQEPKKTLWQFQNYLNEIHDWNMEKVNNEIHQIYTNCGCDYLDDLLTAVFIAHTKVLTAIRLSSNNKKVEINVPKVEHFLFKVLCETAKLLWSSTYLFRGGIPGVEQQQNYRTIENILNEGILQAVRSLVPVKSILKDFVTMDNAAGSSAEGDANDADEESDSEDEKEEIKEIQKEDITIPQPVSIPEILNEPVKELTHQPVQTVETPSQIAPSIDVPISAPVQSTATEQLPPQTIVIDEKANVQFGEFHAVFDMDNPDHSDMIFDSKDEDEDTPDLEILDDIGAPLSEGLDYDDLDESKPQGMSESDYEEL
jgi:hypothetical protein